MILQALGFSAITFGVAFVIAFLVAAMIKALASVIQKKPKATQSTTK